MKAIQPKDYAAAGHFMAELSRSAAERIVENHRRRSA